jgi:hypothetical protein
LVEAGPGCDPVAPGSGGTRWWIRERVRRGGDGVSTVIDRLSVCWRPDAELDGPARVRLDGLARRVCDDGLDEALAEAVGVPGDEVVCIRRLMVDPVRLRWDGADDDLARQWRIAIGRAAEDALAGARPGSEVVRYASVAHARMDVVRGVVAGDLAHRWAWRLAGVCPATGAADAEVVVANLAALGESHTGVAAAVVAALAGAGLLDAFVALIGTEVVVALARAAWVGAGGAATIPTGADPVSGKTWITSSEASPNRAVSALVERVRAGSAIVPAGASGEESPSPFDDTRARALELALAMLAVLDVEPQAASTAVGATAVARLVVPRRTAVMTGSGSALTDAAVDRYPTVDGLGAGAGANGVTGHDDDIAGHGDLGADETGTAVTAARTQTGWGGLLFLLPLIDDVGLPARVAGGPDRYGAALRPVLHAVARSLLARAAPEIGLPDRDDPAVLAFCGLPPDADVPEPDRGVTGATIDTEVEAVVGTLRARLDRPKGMAESAVLLSVCRRRATIEADPGWIDVHLDLDEVSIEVRRHGLDLDPGYLGWLGCVVRFRYGC